MRPRPAISPIAATATAVLSMRSSGRKTAPSRKCGPGSNMRSGHQAGVRLCQSALSRAEEEHASPAGDLRAGQPVHGAPASIALPRGVVCPQPHRITCRHPKTAPARPNHPVLWPVNNRQAPSSLRQALVQTFLNHADVDALNALLRLTEELPDELLGS